MLEHVINISSSTLVSSLTGWRGTTGSKKTKLPEQEIVLFDRESCEQCRLVRQAITELNLNILVYPCPEQGHRYRPLLEEMSGASQLPFLFDQNTGQKLTGSDAVLEYLFSQYADKPVPKKFKEASENGLLNAVKQKAISTLRGGRGETVKSSREAEQTLTLYSFESSPFSRPVRELLCELELAYRLVNLGKQQKADMGPAVQRFHLGPYIPVKGSKREAFLKQYNEVMVPFLIDPNTGTELFQSKKILAYLKREYALK